NVDRLDWLNGQFIRRLPADQLAARLAHRLAEVSVEAILPLVPLVQERLRTLIEASEMLRFFFEEPQDYRPEQLIPKGKNAAASAQALTRAGSLLRSLPERNHEAIDAALRGLAEELGWSARDLLLALRVAIAGPTVTQPPTR